jgi:glutaredoxin
MITLKQWMEVADYRITEGSEFLWECYGEYSYRLDAWDGEQDGASVSIVFDTKDQTVFEVTTYDYANQRAYRLVNPSWVKKHKKEAKRREIDYNHAWDDVEYTDLEVDEDWLEKAKAIVSREVYDTRIQVPLILDNDQLFEMMRLAHERDITLNELVEDVLAKAIEGELIED